MQPSIDIPAAAPTQPAAGGAPRIMVWHIRPAADDDETRNRVIMPAADGETCEVVEINGRAPVL